MDNQNATSSAANAAPTYSSGQPDFAQRVQHSKPLVAIVAVLGVTVMALAAALIVNKSNAQPNTAANMPVAAVTATSPAQAPAVAPVSKLAETPRSIRTTPSTHVAQEGQINQQPRPAAQRVAQAPNNVCLSCGTVEGVTAIHRQGQVNGVAVGNTTIGLGTVAGGLLGGLLGHQVGGGNGRTAMAVLGAAGGAYAGNEVEKNMKKVTVYDVRVRMDNGTTRNMEISSAVPVGSRVNVEGKNLRLANNNG